jgi:hypothetical protein
MIVDAALLVPAKTSVNTLLSLTEQQRATIKDRVRRYGGLTSIDLWLESWGLPTGYVAVRFHFDDGNTLDGGIAPDGVMST